MKLLKSRFKLGSFYFLMNIYQSTRIPVYLVTIMLFFYLLEEIGISFAEYGIYPRSWQGLFGILFAPLVHGNGQHLLSNAMPLLILGTTVYLFYPNSATSVLIWVYLGSGFGIWLFGRDVSFHGLQLVHIGSSGVVYGLAAFLVGSGIVRRQPKSIAIALGVYFLYSGMISGLFPIQQGVSWEGHLSGAFFGIWLSFTMRKLDSEPSRDKNQPPQTNSEAGFQELQTPRWKYVYKPK